MILINHHYIILLLLKATESPIQTIYTVHRPRSNASDRSNDVLSAMVRRANKNSHPRPVHGESKLPRTICSTRFPCSSTREPLPRRLPTRRYLTNIHAVLLPWVPPRKLMPDSIESARSEEGTAGGNGGGGDRCAETAGSPASTRLGARRRPPWKKERGRKRGWRNTAARPP